MGDIEVGTWVVMPRTEDICAKWPTEDKEIDTVEKHLAKISQEGMCALQMPSTQVSSEHELNVSMEIPCGADCDEVGCQNRLELESVVVMQCNWMPEGGHGRGLFAARDIKQGEWVATFGPMRPRKDSDRVEFSVSAAKIGEKAQVLVPSTPRKKWEEKAFKAAFINHCHCPPHRNVDYIPDGMGSVNARAIRAINVGAELIGDYGDDYVFEPHCACCWPVGGSCRWCEP